MKIDGRKSNENRGKNEGKGMKIEGRGKGIKQMKE